MATRKFSNSKIYSGARSNDAYMNILDGSPILLPIANFLVSGYEYEIKRGEEIAKIALSFKGLYEKNIHLSGFMIASLVYASQGYDKKWKSGDISNIPEEKKNKILGEARKKYGEKFTEDELLTDLCRYKILLDEYFLSA